MKKIMVVMKITAISCVAVSPLQGSILCLRSILMKKPVITTVVAALTVVFALFSLFSCASSSPGDDIALMEAIE